MKTLVNRFFLTVVLAGSMLFLQSCDITKLQDAIDDFGVVVELEPINTTATVLVSDEASRQLIRIPVSVTFEGQNGGDVIDLYSDPMPNLTLNSGILTFGLRNQVTPSQTSPATVRVRLEANGYLPKTETFTISNDGASTFFATMIKISAPPAGLETASASAGSADASGATTAPITFEVESTGGEEQEQMGGGIEVDQGTVLVDASGQRLSGALTASITYVHPDEQGAMSIVPVEFTQNVADSVVNLLGFVEASIRDASGRIAEGVEGDAASKAFGANEANVSQFRKEFRLPAQTWNRDRANIRIISRLRNNNNRIIIRRSPDRVRAMPGNQVGILYSIPSNVNPKVAALVRVNPQIGCNMRVNFNRNGNRGVFRLTVLSRGIFRDNILQGNQSVALFDNLPPEPVRMAIRLPNGRVINRVIQNPCSGRSAKDAGFIDYVSNDDDDPRPLPTVEQDVALDPPPPAEITTNVQATVGCRVSGQLLRITSVSGAAIAYRRQGTQDEFVIADNINFIYTPQNNPTHLTGATLTLESVTDGAVYDYEFILDSKVEHRGTATVTGATTNISITVDISACS
jgi:hypothetical protein